MYSTTDVKGRGKDLQMYIFIYHIHICISKEVCVCVCVCIKFLTLHVLSMVSLVVENINTLVFNTTQFVFIKLVLPQFYH